MEKKSSDSSCCQKILRTIRRLTRGSHPQHVNPNNATQMNPVSSPQQYSKPLEPTHFVKPTNTTNKKKPASGGMIPINYESDSTQMPPRKNGRVGKAVSNTDFTEFINRETGRIKRTASHVGGDQHSKNDDGGRKTGLSSSGGGDQEGFGSKDHFRDFIDRTKLKIRNMSSFSGTSSRTGSINK